jgi:hypothetical protein
LRVFIGGAPTSEYSRVILEGLPCNYDEDDGHIVVGPDDKYETKLKLDNRYKKIIEGLADIENNNDKQAKFMSNYANYISELLNEIKSFNDIKQVFKEINDLLQGSLPPKSISGQDLLNSIKKKCEELGSNISDDKLAKFISDYADDISKLLNEIKSFKEINQIFKKINDMLQNPLPLSNIKKKCEELGSHINIDYAFVSRKQNEGREAYDIVLSGCRAYGQLAFFYDLLNRTDFYKKILEHEEQKIEKWGFQAILPIEVKTNGELEWIKHKTTVYNI